ncbi:MAG: penicillin acylase family protein [Lewinellaceae bacterium]|nr:penicillin acylase family protein [Lewinellaceae bacterium]
MMRQSHFTLLFIILHCTLFAQFDPDNITIARDKWGVPHIFAPTDAEVAYGFAWATAEDDFATMQKQILPLKGLMGRVSGKDGARLDVAAHILDARAIVEARYEQDLSPDFRKVLEAYAAGVNAYARQHPKEVLHRKLFPVTGQDIIQSYVLGMALMSGVGRELGNILGGKYKAPPRERGSNAFAIAPEKTADGKTYLVNNSHQPLEGLNSWYEAHLCSEEGWNILGGTFPGGVTIFLGANPHLAWAHTLNYPDFADVYALEMHPAEKGMYRFDGRWEKLAPFPVKARVKILGRLAIGAKQKFYKSKYGVTFETPNGYFALRFPANRDIRAAEQWYRMNKAANLEEFRAALRLQGITCTNIVYADKEGHIFYISNGRFPKRNPAYDWQAVLPGDTSATLWADDYYPIDSLPQVLDPASGYVYNCNHTPFLSSGTADNPALQGIPPSMGFQGPDGLTNRGVRLGALLEQSGKISYEGLKKMKYDQAYHEPMQAAPKLEAIFHLDPEKYPDIAESIRLLQGWDRVAGKDSEAASVMILAFYHLQATLKDRRSFKAGDELDEAKLAEAVRHAQNHLEKHFGSRNVPLGDLQRHARGEVDLPYGGGPDVLAAVRSRPYRNGRLRAYTGDSYIQLVRFSADGPEIESVVPYGTSAKPGSPHYTSQMELFVNQQLKAMTLDREQVLREAVRVYAPGGGSEGVKE